MNRTVKILLAIASLALMAAQSPKRANRCRRTTPPM